MNRRHGPHRSRLSLATGFAVALPLLASLASPVRAALPQRPRITETLGTDRYSLQSITAVPIGAERLVRIEVDGRTVSLKLHPVSYRAPGFRVLVQGAGGGMTEATPPAPETWSGSVEGSAGSIASATIHHGAVHAFFQLPGGPEYYVQPARTMDPEADALAHVVYRGEDVAVVEGSCPVIRDPDEPRERNSTFGADTIIADTLHAEIAFDADYEFFSIYGSVDATVLDIENLMSTINTIYIRDCAIQHRITAIIVRSTPDDPYTTSVSDSLLRQFRLYWNANHTGITRDMAHLMTGKNLDGSTIGIAYLGVVCNRSSAYGVSQSRFTASTSRRASLTAHEMGHNWDADHCDDVDPCNIMCSGLGSCNGLGLPNFEPTGANAIRSWAVSHSCLTSLPVSVVPRGAPTTIQLEAPQPSPFASSTRIRYSMSVPGHVRLAVHDVTGRRRAVLFDGMETAGTHALRWDGSDAAGIRLAPGVWYLQLEAAGRSMSRRIVLVR